MIALLFAERFEMTDNFAGVIFLGTLIAALLLIYPPFGDYMARVVSSPKQASVAKARGVPVAALVAKYESGRGLGFLGQAGANVLKLNLALDRLYPE